MINSVSRIWPEKTKFFNNYWTSVNNRSANQGDLRVRVLRNIIWIFVELLIIRNYHWTFLSEWNKPRANRDEPYQLQTNLSVTKALTDDILVIVTFIWNVTKCLTWFRPYLFVEAFPSSPSSNPSLNPFSSPGSSPDLVVFRHPRLTMKLY